MYINDAVVFLLVFSCITLSGYFIVSRFRVTGLKKFELIISFLGGVSALLIIYNIYITIKSNDRVEKNRLSYNTLQNIQTNYLGPQKELLKNFPEGYFLYASMNQDTDLSEHEPKEFNSAKRAQVEVYGSLRVFQAVEDFLSTAAYDLTGSYVWINNFLMWFQSPILQHNWPLLSFNYADDTNEMVNRIIVKSNELIALRKEKGQLTPKDYDIYSRDFKFNAR